MRIALVSIPLLVLACAPALADPTPRPLPDFELSVDPIGALSNQYGISANLRLGPHAVLRGDFQLDDRFLDSIGDEKTAGVSVQLFLDHAFSGPYFEPGVFARNLPVGEGCYSSTGLCPIGRETILALESFLGYQLTYASHYTVAAAIGMSKPIETYQPIVGYVGPQAESYVRLGYVW